MLVRQDSEKRGLRVLLSHGRKYPVRYEAPLRVAGLTPTAVYAPEADLDWNVWDGLVLTGGEDIDPRYLGEPDGGARETDRARDRAELRLAELFAGAGKPILGICRGHQVLNVALGGTLNQHIGGELELLHSPEPMGLDSDTWHPIRTAPGSLMAELFGQAAVVNSWHHQAVRSPGAGMVVTAWSESGLNEATEHATLPVLTVQFHPERMTGGAMPFPPAFGDGGAIFAWFSRVCGENAQGR